MALSGYDCYTNSHDQMSSVVIVTITVLFIFFLRKEVRKLVSFTGCTYFEKSYQFPLMLVAVDARG